MNLNQSSLIQFEKERKQNEFIPPLGSNSFYDIGKGRINILTKGNNKDAYSFDISIDEGEVYSGMGNFIISGDINSPYDSLTILNSSTLCVNNVLTISNSKMVVYGNLHMLQYSQLIIKDDSEVILYPGSNFIVDNDVNIQIEDNSSLIIYGSANMDIGILTSFLNNKGVIIDSAAVMNVNGLEALGERPFSLTNYEVILRDKVINKYTQGEKNYPGGRVGYTWTSGNPLSFSYSIRMSLLNGEIPLGDFKLSALGLPENDVNKLQIISDIHIKEDTTLYISEIYRDAKYIRPELYLGVIIGNNMRSADCTVDGTIIVDGSNSSITVDRGATLHINESGNVYLRNGSAIRSTYNEDKEVLFINGILTIDDISQIETFNSSNIVFGDKGKLIILNPDTGEKKLLWTTPNGIENSNLYRLFRGRLEHIEYHISNNTGIGIDKYYEFYSRDMKNWYNGMRIEKAIHEGLIVWHDGGFIELYHDVIPWVDTDCTLYHASRIFKTFGSYDPDKLQDAVNRLRYAGCGNILFRFINGDNVGEVTLILEDVHMRSIINNPLTNSYTLNTNNDGLLFIRNKVNKAISSNIISDESRVIDIIDKKVEFTL